MRRIFTAAIASAVILVAQPLSSSTVEADQIANVNWLRTEIGRQPLTVDAELTNYALWYARQLPDRFAHSTIETLLGRWWIVGENIAVSSTWQQAMIALAASPSHYRNMVDERFTSIGVGIHYQDGRLWTVQIFGG